jgi:hypothetical protein
MRIRSCTRYWPACVKFYAADDMQFRVSVFYGLRDGIDNCEYNTVRARTVRTAPPDSKMVTEVVGTLTHPGAPRRGIAPHSASHPACVYHA